MATVIIIFIIASLLGFVKGQQCRFDVVYNTTTYNTYESVLRMPYCIFPVTTEQNEATFKNAIAGVNTNGSIYVLGGKIRIAYLNEASNINLATDYTGGNRWVFKTKLK